MEAGGLSSGAGGPAQAGAASLHEARWSAPWMAAVAADALGIDWRDAGAALDALNRVADARGIATADGRPVRFVDAAALDAPAYEAHIAATGRVPTRLVGDGFVHDALNALAWLRFPRIKAALNALQAREIARDGIRAGRGPLRDAATLFDENAVLLAAADHDPRAQAVIDALRAHEWREALVARRGCWGRRVAAVAFGHALQQKLLRPFASITAHAWAVPVPRAWFGWEPDARWRALDGIAAGLLEAALSSRGARSPLPVMGLPGWCAANAAPDFYDDAAVFRPRSGRATR